MTPLLRRLNNFYKQKKKKKFSSLKFLINALTQHYFSSLAKQKYSIFVKFYIYIELSKIRQNFKK